MSSNSSEKWKRNIVRSYLFNVENTKTSNIEGIVTTVDENMLEEEKDNNLKMTNKNLRSPRMISRRNFFETMNWLKDEISNDKNFVLSNKYIKKIHENLYKGLENSDYYSSGIVGQYKTTPNQIKNNATGKIIYEPCPVNILQEELSKLEKLINLRSGDEFDNHQLIINSALIHALFERIHPFADGNGRLGRILIPIYFLMNSRSDEMFIFMSHSFNKQKKEYYSSLLSIESQKNYDKWIEFYVDRFIYTMDLYANYFEKINSEYDKRYSLFLKNDKLHTIRKYLSIIIKILLTKAYFSIASFIKIWNLISAEITVSKNTYIKVIQVLEKNKLISRVIFGEEKTKFVFYKSEIFIKLNDI